MNPRQRLAVVTLVIPSGILPQPGLPPAPLLDGSPSSQRGCSTTDRSMRFAGCKAGSTANRSQNVGQNGQNRVSPQCSEVNVRAVRTSPAEAASEAAYRRSLRAQNLKTVYRTRAAVGAELSPESSIALYPLTSPILKRIP
jgi:hypothetical protein